MRGMARESNSLNSAKQAGSHNATAQAYQLSPHHYTPGTTKDGLVSNSLTVNGVNDKLLIKNSGVPLRSGDNLNNGYLLKSAQNIVKQ